MTCCPKSGMRRAGVTVNIAATPGSSQDFGPWTTSSLIFYNVGENSLG